MSPLLSRLSRVATARVLWPLRAICHLAFRQISRSVNGTPMLRLRANKARTDIHRAGLLAPKQLADPGTHVSKRVSHR
jgi:hypothetical protein